MNKTKIYMHLAPDALPSQVGALQGFQRIGGEGVVILDIFNKCFCDDASQFTVQMKSWTDKFNKAVFQNERSKEYPIKEVILNIRTDFWCDMKQWQIDNTTCGFKKNKPSEFLSTTEYSNRFKPADYVLYEQRLREFLDYLQFLGILEKCTFDLFGEVNADRYWWETYYSFVIFCEYKIDILADYGCKMLLCHLTASALMKPQQFKPEYSDFINNTPKLSRADIGYSTSLYEWNSAGWFDYEYNSFPTRSFNRTVFVECGYSASLSNTSQKPDVQARWTYFNSPMMMHWFIRLLKFSRSKGSDTVCLFTLCDVNEGDDRGILAYFKRHEGGASTPRPVWNVLMDLMSVIKDGWEVTQDGIVGANGKRITLTDSGYGIV